MKQIRGLIAGALALAIFSAAPAFAQETQGTQPQTVAKGGTGKSSLTANAFLTGGGTSPINTVPITGLVLGNGASAPTPYAGTSGAAKQFLTALNASGAGTFAQPSTSDLTTTINGLVLGNGSSLSAYAGTSCTNQFPRSLNASGAATCASVANTDLVNSSITIGSTTIALGATSTSLAGLTSLAITNNQNAGTSASITNTTNGTAATATLVVTSNVATGSFGAAAPSFATTPILAGRAFAYGVNVNIVVGTSGANAVIFAVNDNETASFTATRGQLSLGASGAAGGSLLLYGSTSGSLNVKAAAIAGSNTLTLPAGTTDFSATGGASQVVKQTSAGGALTVAQLAASDLSNGTTGSGAVALATAPTFVTSITAPIHYGGSAASSTLTLASTSGAGTTDKIILQTASQVTRATMLSSGFLGLGTETNPQTNLVISGNTQTGLTAQSGTLLLMVAADSSSTIFQQDAYGTGVFSGTRWRGARGTAASPTATQSGDVIGFLGAHGYGTSFASAADASIVITAAETFSGTAHGSKMAFNVIQTGTLSSIGLLTLQGSGSVVLGNGSVSTSATDGFVYIPGGAGAPTGVPTANTGRQPLYIDTTNNKLCFYNAAWKCSAAFT